MGPRDSLLFSWKGCGRTLDDALFVYTSLIALLASSFQDYSTRWVTICSYGIRVEMCGL